MIIEGVFFLKVIIDVGMIFGIKVDIGVKNLVNYFNEKVIEGLDGLGECIVEYY